MLDNLLLSLNTVLPVLILTVVGIVLKRIKLLPDAFYDGADKFVFKIALPAMIFLQVAGADISEGAKYYKLPLFAVPMICLTCLIFSLLTPLFVKDRRKVGAMVQSMFRSNAAILGVVFIENLFADPAERGVALAAYAITAAFVILAYNVLSVVVLTVFMPSENGEKNKIDIKKILLSTIKNPLIIAVLLGLPFMIFGIKLPSVATSSLKYLSNATTGLALISLGAEFSFSSLKGNISHAVITSLIKTVIHPILGVGAAYLLGFRGSELLIIFIIFGTPAAVSSYIMAKNMKSDYELAGQILLLSTMACILTIFLGTFVMRTLGWF